MNILCVLCTRGTRCFQIVQLIGAAEITRQTRIGRIELDPTERVTYLYLAHYGHQAIRAVRAHGNNDSGRIDTNIKQYAKCVGCNGGNLEIIENE